MLTIGKYKKILDTLPQGVFVFNDKLQVKCTNVAFRRAFSDGAKKKGTLAEVLACSQGVVCGKGAVCENCAFQRVMRLAVSQKKEQEETLHTSVNHGGRIDRISMRIRVLPIDEKGKLFLGMTEGTYYTEIEKEMLTAQQMQRRLLPAGKSMGGITYAYTYLPKFGVGGDLPEVYELDGQTYGVLSDVSGKGISAGMLATFLKVAFDKTEPDLGVALSKLNGKFNELNQDECSYITVSAVRMDKRSGVLRYAVAGHNAPILLKNEYGINEIESPAPPISNWMPDYAYEEREMPFARGDILVMLTDGVTECLNSAGEQFGIERVESVLMQSASAEDFIAKIKSALHVYCGGEYTDDVTAVAFDL